MRAVSTEEKQTWHSGIQKYLTLTFEDGTVLDNNDIVSESLSLEQSICKDNELLFGQCSSSCLKTQIIITGDKRFKGLRFTATLTAGEYTRPLGTFIVNSDTATSDRIYRDLVCYDELMSILSTNYSTWHNSLEFPMTLKQYRDSFFDYIGIQQVDTVLINDTMQIAKNFVAETYSGADVLKSICELNGTCGFLNFDNKFQYVVFTSNEDALYPDTELYPAHNIYPRDWVTRRIGRSTQASESYLQGSLTFEDFTTQAITQVQIRQTSDDVGAVIGTPGNTYIIQGNPLLFGKTTDELSVIANRFLSVVRYIQYTPSQVSAMGALWQELGDSVGIYSSDGHDVVMFILNRTLTGITSLVDTYEAAGSEYYSEKANSVNLSVLVLQQKTNELSRTAEETISTIKELQEDLDGSVTELSSRIKQTAKSISLSVTNNTANTTASLEIAVTKEDGTSGGTATGKINLTGLVSFSAIQGNNRSTTKINGNNISTGIIHDEANNTTFNLSTGELTVKKGSIILGDTSSNKYFRVTSAGQLTAVYGKIGDFTIGSCLYYGNKTSWSRYTYDGIYIGKEGIAVGSGAGSKHGFAITPDGYGYCDRMYFTDYTGHQTNYSWHCDYPYHGTLAIATGGPIDVNQEGDGVTKIHNTSIIDSYEGGVSDRRQKKNISNIPIEKSLSLLMKLKPVYYEYNDEKQEQSRFNEGLRHGFIAQDVLDALGDESQNTGIVFKQDDGFYSLRYETFIADAVNVLKLHEERIAELEMLHVGDNK